MRGKVIVKMNSRGAAALLKSREVQDDLKARADRIAASAGPGFEASVTVLRTRAAAAVTATTEAARQAEANGRVLTQALDAGR